MTPFHRLDQPLRRDLRLETRDSRLAIPKSGGEIPHNSRLVAGDIARVRVPENHRVARAKVAGSAHDGHHWAASARMLRPPVECTLKPVRVETRDMIDDDAVQARGRGRVVVVR